MNFRPVPGYSLDTARPKTVTMMSLCQVDPLGLAMGTVRPGSFAPCSGWSWGGSRMRHVDSGLAVQAAWAPTAADE